MDNDASEKNEILMKAYIFLEEGYFDKAHEFFSLAKRNNSNSYKTALGLILSEYKCRNEQELIENYPTIVFFDADFVSASSRATGEEALIFSELKKSAKNVCFRNFIEYLSENDWFLVKKWANHYLKTLDNAQDELSTLLKDIAACDTKDYTGKLEANLLRLYEACKRNNLISPQSSDSSKQTALTDDSFESIYANRLNELKDNILSEFDEEIFRLWLEPDAYYKKYYSSEVPISCDVDGFSSKKEERHLEITKLLWKTSFKANLQFYALIEEQYNELLKYASNKTYVQLSMNKFFNRIIAEIQRGNAAEGHLSFVLEKAPDNSVANRLYILRKTDEFKKTNSLLGEDRKLESFLQATAKDCTQELAQQLIDKTETLISKEKEFYESCCLALEPYAQKAIANTTDDTENFQKKWTAYSADIKNIYETNIKTLNDRINKITKKLKSSNSKQKLVAKTKYVFTILISLFFLFISLCTVLLPASLWNGDDFIEYNIFTVFAGASGVIAVYSLIIQLILFAMRKNLCSEKSLLKKKSKRNLRILSVCILAVCLFSFGFTAIEGLTFNSRLGIIEISKTSQFNYISNNPGGNYVLTKDIDASGDAVCIKKLSGSLDGNGYTISNISTEETAFICTNTGTVKNINFTNAVLSNALIETNKGVFSNSSFTDCALHTPTIASNKKEVSKISFAESTLEADIATTYIAFIVGDNNADATVSHCTVDSSDINISTEQELITDFYTGAVVAYNNGTVLNCHTTADIKCALKVQGLMKQSAVCIGGIAGYCETDYDKGAISYSSATADINFTAKYALSDDAVYEAYINIGGIAGSGRAEKTYFKGNINVDVNADAKKHELVFMNCYQIGSLAGEGSHFEDCFARGDIKVSAVNKNDDILCKFTIGNAIGQGQGKDEWLTRCYTAVNCNIKLDSEKYNYAHPIGNLIYSSSDSSDSAQQKINITGSFIYGTSEVKKALGLTPDEYPCKKLYVSSKLYPDAQNSAANSLLLSPEFIYDELNWDKSVWLAEYDSFPELNQYVLPEDTLTQETTEDTTTESLTE